MNSTELTPRLTPTQHTVAALATSVAALIAALVVAREPFVLRCELGFVIIAGMGVGLVFTRISALALGLATAVSCAALTVISWSAAAPAQVAERTAWLLLLTMALLTIALGAHRLATAHTETLMPDADTAPMPVVTPPSWNGVPDTTDLELSPGQRKVWLVDRALAGSRAASVPVTRVMPRVVIARTSDGFTTAPAPTCAGLSTPLVTEATPPPTIDVTDLPLLVGQRGGRTRTSPRRNPFVQAGGGIPAAGPDRTDLGTLRSERPAMGAPRSRTTPGPALVPLSTGRVTLEVEFDRARLNQGALAVLVLSTAGVPGARPLPYRVDETGPWGQAALSDRAVHDLVPPAVLGAIVSAVTSTISADQTAFVITPDELGIVVPGLSVEEGWELRGRLLAAITDAIAALGLGLQDEDGSPVEVRSSMVFVDDDTPSARDLLQDARRALHHDWDSDWLS